MKRTSIAAACMAAGVVLAPLGVGLQFGVGYGLTVAGLALAGIAVLLGWDA